MPSCLGLYIENNLIKYAKVSKSNEVVKVESFGIKFHEKIEDTIKQIVEETYSYKIPISINTNDEMYNQIKVFSLLNKKDMDNAIKTEFENICYEKDLNENLYEKRYLITDSDKNSDKINIIHISTTKTFIEQRKNQFDKYRISNITPLSVSLTNLIKKEKKGTVMIVNIEKNTTVTKVINGRISDINIIDNGSQEILNKINQKENSYLKAYDICKAATIYTENDKDLQYEENEYFVDIMPTLFEIVTQVRRIVNESIENIEKIYITGTAAIISNIDIYFQDYLRDIRCEVLKPSFINNNSKINIKDYIEVNSAISIALQGLQKDKSMNFTRESNAEKVLSLLNSNLSDVKQNAVAKSAGEFFGKFRNLYNTISTTFLMLMISYFTGAILINNQLENKITLANNSIATTNERIAKIEGYNNKFNYQISQYQTLINNIENLNNANSEDKRYKNTIPNLLNNIMAVIPKSVQLTSIKNTSNTHIVISAKAERYEQLAYFKTKLKTEGILENVVSDTGTAQGGTVSVTIEGELP